MKEFRVLGLGKGLGEGAELGATVLIELEGVPYAPIHDHRGNVVCLVDPATGKAADNIRIRPEQHPFHAGDAYNPRHHEVHYHVETRRNPLKSWGQGKEY